MLVAITGPGCPSSNTNAALLAMWAAAAMGLTAAYVRVVGADEPCLRTVLAPSGAVGFVEVPPPDAAGAVVASGGPDLTLVEVGTDVIGQLPPIPFDALLMGVGPYASDLRRAALAFERLPDRLARVTWFLGLGRGDVGPGQGGFEREVRAALGGAGAESAPSVLAAGVPPLRRAEADALLGGGPRGRTLGAGVALLAALACAVQAAGSGACADSWGQLARDFAEEAAAGGSGDGSEGLRRLADDLERIADGEGPNSQDLAGAPVLDRWNADIRVVRSLVGVVDGHSAVPSGRRVRTSEVYATDGRTWARTLSRFYSLGRPAGSTAHEFH